MDHILWDFRTYQNHCKSEKVIKIQLLIQIHFVSSFVFEGDIHFCDIFNCLRIFIAKLMKESNGNNVVIFKLNKYVLYMTIYVCSLAKIVGCTFSKDFKNAMKVVL